MLAICATVTAVAPVAAMDIPSATHSAYRFLQIHAARIAVIIPTQVASSRWVCSKKIPPTQREIGKVNMLYP